MASGNVHERLRRLERKFAALDLKHSLLEGEYEALQISHNDIQEALEDEINLLAEECEEVSTENVRLLTLTSRLQFDGNKGNEELSKAEQSLKRARQKEMSLQAQIMALKEGNTDNASKVRELEQLNQELTSTQRILQADIEAKEEDLEGYIEEIDRLEVDREDAANRFQETLAEVLEENQQLKTQLEELKGTLTEVKGTMSQIKTQTKWKEQQPSKRLEGPQRIDFSILQATDKLFPSVIFEELKPDTPEPKNSMIEICLSPTYPITKTSGSFTGKIEISKSPHLSDARRLMPRSPKPKRYTSRRSIIVPNTNKLPKVKGKRSSLLLPEGMLNNGDFIPPKFRKRNTKCGYIFTLRNGVWKRQFASISNESGKPQLECYIVRQLGANSSMYRISNINLHKGNVEVSDKQISGKRHLFQVKPAFSKKIYVFAAPNREESFVWVETMEEYIDEAKQKKAREVMKTDRALGFTSRSRDQSVSEASPSMSQQSTLKNTSLGIALCLQTERRIVSGFLEMSLQTDSLHELKWEKKFFELKPDDLAMQQYSDDTKKEPLGKVSLITKLGDKYFGAMVAPFPSLGGRKYLFNLCPPMADRTYIFQSSSQSDKTYWLESLGYHVDLKVERDPYSTKEGYLHLLGNDGLWHEKYFILKDNTIKHYDRGMDTGCCAFSITKDSELSFEDEADGIFEWRFSVTDQRNKETVDLIFQTDEKSIEAWRDILQAAIDSHASINSRQTNKVTLKQKNRKGVKEGMLGFLAPDVEKWDRALFQLRKGRSLITYYEMKLVMDNAEESDSSESDTGQSDSKFDLGGEMVKQGWLYQSKVKVRGNSRKKRYFMLTKKALNRFKKEAHKEKKKPTMHFVLDKYSQLEIIQGPHASIRSRWLASEGNLFPFHIIIQGKLQFQLEAATEDERKEWIQMINETVYPKIEMQVTIVCKLPPQLMSSFRPTMDFKCESDMKMGTLLLKSIKAMQTNQKLKFEANNFVFCHPGEKSQISCMDRLDFASKSEKPEFWLTNHGQMVNPMQRALNRSHSLAQLSFGPNRKGGNSIFRGPSMRKGKKNQAKGICIPEGNAVSNQIFEKNESPENINSQAETNTSDAKDTNGKQEMETNTPASKNEMNIKSVTAPQKVKHESKARLARGARLGTITLLHSSIIALSPEDYDGRANLIGIKPHLSKKMYILQTETSQEYGEWINEISPCLQKKKFQKSSIEGYLSFLKKKEKTGKEKWKDYYIVLTIDELMFFKQKKKNEESG